MSQFHTLSILIGFAAFCAFINYRYLKLPATIGLMVVSIGVSLAVVCLGHLGFLDIREPAKFVLSLDFEQILLHGMLAFLLFAGALHVDLRELSAQKLPIFILSTVGVVISATIIGALLWLLTSLFGVQVPFPVCLVFGTLISPTDPVAVLGILRGAGIPPSLQIKITGESLFNDGVGVVAFLAVSSIAFGGGETQVTSVLLRLGFEVAGAVVLGLICGYLVFLALKSVDQYQVEVFLTLALASCGYALAEILHVSAPIAIVVAGLVIGNQGRALAMSETTREHLDSFWELIDEFLNAVLFALIGLEVLAIDFDLTLLLIGVTLIPVVLLARFVSVGLPVWIMSFRRIFAPGAIRILTWGGLRGGISVALALSLPLTPEHDLLVTSTYVVVVFSIFVQGLTLGPYSRRLQQSKAGVGL